MFVGCNLSGTPVDVLTNGFRVMAAAGLSVGDASACGTLWGNPVNSSQITLLDSTGTIPTLYTASQFSLALSGMTTGKNYDVFVYQTAGVLSFELSAAFTNDTTRTDAVTQKFGIYVKNADNTRRHVATIRASSATTYEDSETQPWLWNRYNQTLRRTRTGGVASAVSNSSTTAAVIDAVFDTTILNGGILGLINARLSLTINNPTAGAFLDAYVSVLVGATEYDLGSFIADNSLGYQPLTYERDVPLPYGATLCRARWRISTGTGSIKIDSTARGILQLIFACNLQLSLFR